MALRPMPGNFSGDFSLQITVALRDQIVSALSQLVAAPLDLSHVSALEKRGGVYLLFMDDVLAYVGKADGNLQGRLQRHHDVFAGRLGGVLPRVSFKCVYVDDDLHAISPERMLIAYHTANGEARMNFKGFGSNDPGKERDTSAVDDDHFDAMFPINLALEVQLEVKPDTSLFSLMMQLKQSLPYNLRFPKATTVSGRALGAVVLEEPPGTQQKSVDDWLTWIADHMPDGWQIIALPGYIIAYPGANPSAFSARRKSWVSLGGSARTSGPEATD